MIRKNKENTYITHNELEVGDIIDLRISASFRRVIVLTGIEFGIFGYHCIVDGYAIPQKFNTLANSKILREERFLLTEKKYTYKNIGKLKKYISKNKFIR